MSDSAFSLCVYCGSRPGSLPAYADAARAVDHWIGSHGGQLVYGGGRNGLMGLVADSTMKAGGRVVGVIPRALVEKEWAHHGCTELHVVDTMHERKRLMAEHADAFIVLPGGLGTLEELFETLTLVQCKKAKPVPVVLFGSDYWKRVLNLSVLVEEGVISPEDLNLFQFIDDVDEAWRFIQGFYKP